IDAMRAMARFPLDEMLVGAKLYAEKINKAKGPLKLVVPLRGWSSLDAPGSILHDPAQDRLFMDELKRNLTNPIEIEEVDANLEELQIASALVDSLDAMMSAHKSSTTLPGPGA
ncbi:MAG: Tm-1-like ATP-binding domain-containing protein, partial [Negativicutes bacterium]|nr:Tm-1-like ATP-binding domain-containing protein [Negativicutes bacterium]